MARPIPKLGDLAKTEEIKPKDSKSIVELAVDTIKNKSTKNLFLGTLSADDGSNWFVPPEGVIIRVRASREAQPPVSRSRLPNSLCLHQLFRISLRPPSEDPQPAVIQRPEPYRPEEFIDKPFYPVKPIPCPARIAPSSIPNPNPSIIANNEGFPNSSGSLYNIPGYSAFQLFKSPSYRRPPTPAQTEPRDFSFTISGPCEIKEQEQNIFERREGNALVHTVENAFDQREQNTLDQREPITFDQREPITFDQREPITFDQRGQNAFDQREQNTLDQREPITFDQREPITFDQRRQNAFDQRGQNAFDQREQNTLDQREPITFDQREPITFDQRRQNAFDQRGQNAFDQREQNTLDQREPITFDQRRQNAFDQREQNALDQRGHKAYDLQEKNAFDQRERNAFDQREQKAFDLHEKNAFDQREQNALDQRRQKAFDLQEKNAFDQRDQIAFDQRGQKAFDLQENNAFDQREQIAFDQREQNAFDQQGQKAFDLRKNSAFDQREQIAFDQREQIALDQRGQKAFDLRENNAFDQREQIAFDQREQIALDQRGQKAFDQREQIAFDQREQIAFDQREQITLDQRGQKAFDQRGQKAFDLQEKNAFGQREQNAFDQREQIALDQRGQKAFDQREQNAFDQRGQIAFDQRGQKAFDLREQIAFDQREQNAFDQREQIAFDQREQIALDQRGQKAFDLRGQRPFDLQEQNAFDQREEIAFDQREQIAFDQRGQRAFDLQEQKNAFDQREQIGFDQREQIAFDLRGQRPFDLQEQNAFDQREQIAFDQREQIAFDQRGQRAFDLQEQKNAFDQREQIGYDQREQIAIDHRGQRAFDLQEQNTFDQREQIAFGQREQIAFEQREPIAFDQRGQRAFDLQEQKNAFDQREQIGFDLQEQKNAIDQREQIAFNQRGQRAFDLQEQKNAIDQREQIAFNQRGQRAFDLQEQKNAIDQREQIAFNQRGQRAFDLQEQKNAFDQREQNAFGPREQIAFDQREQNAFNQQEKREAERKEAGTPKQQDFEDNFTMKIIPSSKTDVNKTLLMEPKMTITSLAQGSGGSVTIPTPINMDIKNKFEKLSLKTSIPISKIDMKCVNTLNNTMLQNVFKKPVFNPAFHKNTERPKVEIHSNILIKTATITTNNDTKVINKPVMIERENLTNIKLSNSLGQNNITLINAADVIKKNDGPFRLPEPKVDVPKEVKNLIVITQPASRRSSVNTIDISPAVSQPLIVQSPIFNSVNTDASKSNLSQSTAMTRPTFVLTNVEPNKQNSAQPIAVPRPVQNPTSEESKPNLAQVLAISKPTFIPVSPESKLILPNKSPNGGNNDQKKITFLNQTNLTSQMLLSIKPNPQVVLQRTNFEPKNVQVPSRLSSQNNDNEDIASTSSNVVALKRLHQDNSDENDFENLITENQIYGNKIVVKAKNDEWKNKNKVVQHTPQHWKKKFKIDVTLDNENESKSVVVQPNCSVYLTNMQLPSNLMMVNNTPKISQTTDTTKIKDIPNDNKTEINIVNNNNVETNVAKKSKPEIVTNKLNETHVSIKSSNNVCPTVSFNNNKTDVVVQTSQKVTVRNVNDTSTKKQVRNVNDTSTKKQVRNVNDTSTKKQVRKVNEADKSWTVKEPKPIKKKEITKNVETKPDKVIKTSQVKAKSKAEKVIITSITPPVASPEPLDEISTIDSYEHRKRLKRLRYLTYGSFKDITKLNLSATATKVDTKPSIILITPDKIDAEIFKEFMLKKEKKKVESSDSESDSEEDELDEYNTILERYGANYNENAKAEFLTEFSLVSKEICREKQLEQQERTIKCDAIASAYMAAGRLDPFEEQHATIPLPEPEVLKVVNHKYSNMRSLRQQKMYLANFKLMQNTLKNKKENEKIYEYLLQERRRNEMVTSPEPFDTSTQLQMLTEINKSVNENNDLIKKRLDAVCDENSDIKTLAEKNFSELDRLSKMADQSVKLFSGKDANMRDLNPGFDSENIKKPDVKHHPLIKIPDVSKIISLKTNQEASVNSTTPATSMDEPSNSASLPQLAGSDGSSAVKVVTSEVGCQADENIPWQSPKELMDYFTKIYREYEKARKKQAVDIQRSSTQMRVASAHVTRAASRDSDQAQALLAERQHLAVEEASLKTSLQKLTRAIEIIRNS